MTLDQGEYFKIPPIPEVQKEALSRGDLIWEDSETKIFYPENPLVQAQEGIHLRIESPEVPLHPKTFEEWKAWLRHWAKTIGTGKVVSEGGALPDMWQSFLGRTEYTPEDHLVTEIIGRNPKAESWGRTAPFPGPSYNNREKRLGEGIIHEVSATLERFFRQYWIPELAKVELFSQRPLVNPPGSPGVQEVYERNTKLPYPWESEPILVSDTVDIVAILQPHLKTGIHLMIGVNQAPRRPWRDLVRSLQGLAVAEKTGQFLEETTFGGEPVAAWTSIRATGSWFAGFQRLINDPAFQDETIPRKWLKRRFRGANTQAGQAQDWTMNFHPHVYGARYKDELIRLTQRPRHEGGLDWEGIEPMSHGRRLLMRDVLNRRLFPELLPQAAGSIKLR